MNKPMKFKLQWWDGDVLFIVWVHQVDLWQYNGIPYRVIKILEV